MRLAPLALGTAALALAACGDRDTLVLRSEDGAVTLSYNCAARRPVAERADELKLIRQQAGRVVRYEAEEGREERTAAFRQAIHAMDDTALEAALIRYGCDHGMPSARGPRFPERGSTPPALALEVMDGGGRRVTLSEERGRVVVLNFWATWCGPCVEEWPELQQVARDYAGQGVVVYGILHKDPPRSARAFVQRTGGGFPILLDEDGAAARAAGVRGIPHTLVLGRDGRVVSSAVGYGPGRLEEHVRAALAGEDGAPASR